ncbi:hypothetical protein [Mucisphaera sp.]|uniref:hypothetical protein n=1 Tax=Mucisphaera sp. TaxID=2913024 RepID=UPI003D0D0290
MNTPLTSVERQLLDSLLRQCKVTLPKDHPAYGPNAVTSRENTGAGLYINFDNIHIDPDLGSFRAVEQVHQFLLSYEWDILFDSLLYLTADNSPHMIELFHYGHSDNPAKWNGDLSSFRLIDDEEFSRYESQNR